MRRSYSDFRVLRGALLLLAVCLAAASAVHAAEQERFALRGYGVVTHEARGVGKGGTAVAVHTFGFADAGHASRFVSKLLSDFELSAGNKIGEVTFGKFTADAALLPDGGCVLPLLAKGEDAVAVLAGGSVEVVAREAAQVCSSEPLRRSEVSHPLFMDKWDRYPIGMWQAPGDFAQDSLRKDPDAFYKWMGEIGLNPQLNVGKPSIDLANNDNQTTWLRRYLTAYGVKYQRVEWLFHDVDLYNRNPFLTQTINPHAMTAWNYYGELRDASALLRSVQIATYLPGLRATLGDPNQMAILDPNGEIGPFENNFWGVSGPVHQRNFVRYLRDVRKLALKDVSQRYFGNADAVKSWEEVTLADWREFYGWTEGALDLAGQWRFMRDDRLEGFKEAWASPSFDDADWVKLYYPGDSMAYFLINKERPLWMRRSFSVEPSKFPGKVYLTVAPLSASTVQVYLNGAPLGALDPRFHTANTFGQFEVGDELRKHPDAVVALRFAAGDTPNGPVFLTAKPLEDFPTSDPRVNARRYDQMDYVDWAVADSVESTLRGIRAIEPDRPIKVHAYSGSPRGWQVLARNGGYSHHTGSGAGWAYTVPKQYGLSRNLQDSSEPGGPMSNLRDLKGLWGNLIFMGKNAHDYFINLQSITRDPAMRAYFEERLPAMKLMGRAQVLSSPLAAIRGTVNTRYQSEFGRFEDWRYGVDLSRGGEMTPLLDEVRIREGNLPYEAVVDEGTPCWDAEMAAALKSYVEEGGILVLNALSGIHTFEERGKGAGPSLAGVALGEPPANDSSLTVKQAAAPLEKLPGVLKIWSRPGFPGRVLTPAEGTDVVAAWPDGSAALTRRAVGKGIVYFCGGSAYPPDFIKTLVAEVGLSTMAKAEGGADHVRMLRANNGCEDLLMVRGLGDKPAKITWTLDHPVTEVFDPLTGKPVPAEIAGDTATITTTIPDWDFAWFAVRRPGADARFAHWLQRQTEMWSGFVKDATAPEALLFRHLDLSHEWRCARVATFDAAAALREKEDAEAGMSPVDLVLWDAPGERKAADAPAGLYRRQFDIPVPWRQSSRFALAVKGQIHDCAAKHGVKGKTEIWLNGAKIWEGQRLDTAWLDATAHIKHDGNRLEIVHEGDGIMANLMLVRSAVPAATVDLAGPWRAVDGFHAEREATLPGAVEASYVYRDIEVPAQHKSKEIWLRVEGNCPFIMINGRVRYWDQHGVGTCAINPAYEVDITPDVRFGAANRIVIGSGSMTNGWKKGRLEYKKVELLAFEPGAWSVEGKGTREALSVKELADVARDLGTAKLYPMVTAEIERKAAEAPTGAVKAPALTPSLLDLDFSSKGAPADAGTDHLPVVVKGQVVPFSEAGGRIVGAWLKGETKEHGYLEVASPLIRKRLTNGRFTIRAWIKPMAVASQGGALFNWGAHQLSWCVFNDRCQVSFHGGDPRRLNAETVIRQRQWQFLALVVDGATATLYADGVPVARQTWDRPVSVNDAPIVIGSNFGQNDFIDAKLAALTVYEEVLTTEGVAALYHAEKSKFAAEPSKAWPENDLLHIVASKDGPLDATELPAAIKAGPGVSVVDGGDGKPVLSFSGTDSYLIVNENARLHLLHDPYSIIFDIKPAPEAAGMLFRRHHEECLSMDKDGSLILDTNIGRNKRLVFPKAVPRGRWTRIMLTYDGKTAGLFVDGKLVSREAYPGVLCEGRFPFSIGADNTLTPYGHLVKMEVRGLRIIPAVLDAMPE